MKGPLSLEQELRQLRAPRGVKWQKRTNRSDSTPDLQQSERPWQADIERIQQTMREVLRAIASFSGVELPGLPPGLQNDRGPLLRLDINTLKDRFRNDLEGFSIQATEELSKRAKEQTHAALDEIKNEIGGRIDQVAAELRGQLQVPAQFEKLVETSLNEAAARLESSLSQRVEELFAGRERVIQERLQEVLSPVQAQVSTVEESAARLEMSLTQKVEQLFAERERLVQERLQEALMPVQTQVSTVEESAARLETSLTQKVEQLFAERDRLVQERLQEALMPVQTQVSTVEEAAARLETSLTQKVEQLFAERDRLVQERLQQAPNPSQMQTNTVEETEARLESSLTQKVEQLFAERQRLIQERLQESLRPVQAQVGTLEGAEARLERSLTQKVDQLFAKQERLIQERLLESRRPVQDPISGLEQIVQQIRELTSDSVAQLSVVRPKEATDNAMKEHESNPKNEVKVFLDGLFSRIDWSLYDFTETPKIQPAQHTAAGLEGQHKGISFNDADTDIRVQQALEYLGQLGSKNPHPASKAENLKATS